jgi:hypothetical protein
MTIQPYTEIEYEELDNPRYKVWMMDRFDDGKIHAFIQDHEKDFEEGEVFEVIIKEPMKD